VLPAIALLVVAAVLSSVMRTQWQLMLIWGVLVGSGTGVTSLVLAAVAMNQWFEKPRGLVLGVQLPAGQRPLHHLQRWYAVRQHRPSESSPGPRDPLRPEMDLLLRSMNGTKCFNCPATRAQLSLLLGIFPERGE
jgi:hypothetical protein